MVLAWMSRLVRVYDKELEPGEDTIVIMQMEEKVTPAPPLPPPAPPARVRNNVCQAARSSRCTGPAYIAQQLCNRLRVCVDLLS